LFFNLGVEVGQLAFIGLVSGLFLVISSGLKKSRLDSHSMSEVITRKRMELVAAYVIGIPSSYWLIERVAQFIL